MIQTIAAAVIWVLVLCLLPGVRTRKDHSILVAAVAIATALALNIDPIYRQSSESSDFFKFTGHVQKAQQRVG